MEFHDPRGVFVGRDMGGREHAIGPDLLRHHAAGTGDRLGWQGGEPLPAGADAPALLFHSEVYAELG